ncbi:hypothetical protein [Kitasatospora viridis]|uniref:Uncharacterized protein n=1 Tax=Kitasatospora viridis TaxID=281105 RepID=A0A561T6P1_9ACTN|nr:hypothetical protein [Kitasatospora viridis]TWF82784.1 hypothetical protein FHX73_14266 [Kitasatospora viridis]
MLIEGYDGGPLVPSEPLLERAGFWPHHLLTMCRFTPDGPRPVPEWFGADGADTDALSEVILDERAWPTLRLPIRDGHCAVVVYRNLVGDYGIDYLLTHPDRPRSQELATYDGDWRGAGLPWRELLLIAEAPDPAAPGVHDPAARLLLLLPLLADDELPPQAPERVRAALVAIGAPEDSAEHTAAHLLRNRREA